MTVSTLTADLTGSDDVIVHYSSEIDVFARQFGVAANRKGLSIAELETALRQYGDWADSDKSTVAARWQTAFTWADTVLADLSTASPYFDSVHAFRGRAVGNGAS